MCYCVFVFQKVFMFYRLIYNKIITVDFVYIATYTIITIIIAYIIINKLQNEFSTSLPPWKPFKERHYSDERKTNDAYKYGIVTNVILVRWNMTSTTSPRSLYMNTLDDQIEFVGR